MYSSYSFPLFKRNKSKSIWLLINSYWFSEWYNHSNQLFIFFLLQTCIFWRIEIVQSPSERRAWWETEKTEWYSLKKSEYLYDKTHSQIPNTLQSAQLLVFHSCPTLPEVQKCNQQRHLWVLFHGVAPLAD